MTKLAASALIVGFALMASAAVAEPVTMKDLVGKKVCWTTISASYNPPAMPGFSTYSYGGNYHDSWWGSGTFTLTAQGYHADTTKGSFDSQLEKLPGGKFRSTMTTGPSAFVSEGHYYK